MLERLYKLPNILAALFIEIFMSEKKIQKNPCTFGNFLSIKHIKSVMHFQNNCYDCNKMFVDFSHSLPYIEVFRDIPLSSRVWSPSRPYSTYHIKLTQTTLDLLNQKLTKELKVTIHILILSVEKSRIKYGQVMYLLGRHRR